MQKLKVTCFPVKTGERALKRLPGKNWRSWGSWLPKKIWRLKRTKFFFAPGELLKIISFTGTTLSSTISHLPAFRKLTSDREPSVLEENSIFERSGTEFPVIIPSILTSGPNFIWHDSGDCIQKNCCICMNPFSIRQTDTIPSYYTSGTPIVGQSQTILAPPPLSWGIAHEQR